MCIACLSDSIGACRPCDMPFVPCMLLVDSLFVCPSGFMWRYAFVVFTSCCVLVSPSLWFHHFGYPFDTACSQCFCFRCWRLGRNSIFSTEFSAPGSCTTCGRNITFCLCWPLCLSLAHRLPLFVSLTSFHLCLRVSKNDNVMPFEGNKK